MMIRTDRLRSVALTRRCVRLAALSICAVSLAVVGGCKKTEATAVDANSMLGAGSASVEGGFSRKSYADLQTPSPIRNIYLRGEYVFAYTQDNSVYVLNRALDVKWVKQIVDPKTTLRPPLVYGDQFIFPAVATLEIYKNDGTFVRSQELPAALTTDVELDQGGMLLAGTASPTGGRLTLIDPARQFMVVKHEVLVGTVTSKPAGFQGVTFVTNSVGQIYAVGDENRAVWGLTDGAFRIDRPVQADLSADDYGLYVPATDGVLYVLDRSTGRIKWRYVAEEALRTSPFITSTTVYQVVPGRGLVALDKVEGKPYRDPLWTVAGVTRVVAVDATRVYALADENRLVAIDVKSGEVQYNVTHQFGTFAKNIGTDGTVYAATAAGQVMAITTSRFGTSSGSIAQAK
jgi:outer membrane protein assembly factor BamB